jgi:hypothetical protein
MSKFRAAIVAASACLALTAVGVPAASAANGTTVPPKVTSIPALYTLKGVTGVAKNGKKFSGSYGIQRFVAQGDKVVALGTLKGKLDGRHVTRYNVAIPVQLTGASGARASQATCQILHLVLGPVNLNLLGLKVTLGGGTAANQPIVLDLTAVQGAGLLGDLLCGVDNLLNQTGALGQLTGSLNNLAASLNSIVALLGGLQGA